MSRNSFTSLRNVRLSLNPLYQIQLYLPIVVRNSYTEIHKNLADGIFADTRSRADGETQGMWSQHKAFFLTS
jgi:hypothetical protein